MQIVLHRHGVDFTFNFTAGQPVQACLQPFLGKRIHTTHWHCCVVTLLVWFWVLPTLLMPSKLVNWENEMMTSRSVWPLIIDIWSKPSSHNRIGNNPPANIETWHKTNCKVAEGQQNVESDELATQECCEQPIWVKQASANDMSVLTSDTTSTCCWTHSNAVIGWHTTNS